MISLVHGYPSFSLKRFPKEMGRSKHKSGQQNCQSQNLNSRTRSKARSPSPESEEELEERITVSRYGEKNDENVFSFRLLQLMTEEKVDVFTKLYPAGFPEGQYFIAVKELVIEWEDYQNEYCGYVECLQCECEVMKNMNSERKWVNCITATPSYIDLNKDKQLLRFVKPPGRKNTFIHIPNEEEAYYGLKLDKRSTPFGNKRRRLHEIQCAIRPMFDENEVLPIKYAHITVEIMIGNG